tara:strand:+ start:49 stop:213 length:165 start_codon:yes stop_codon:yes gene_type:complete
MINTHSWHNPIKYKKPEDEWEKILKKYNEEDKFKKPNKKLDSKPKTCYKRKNDK